jgi:signal transduction histidine kinase
MANEIIFEKKITSPSISYALNNNKDINLTTNKLELSRILSNLLDNSIHALEEQSDPKITISLEAVSNLVKIEVIDNGKGIPESVIKVIGTERFSSKPLSIGNGIGLLHAKRSIEEMSGSFEIDSKDGEYTKVTITLPVSIS